MQATGDDLNTASRLQAHPTNHAYDLIVELEVSGNVQAGIYLGNRSLNPSVGVGLRPGESFVFGKRYQRTERMTEQKRVWVRLRNDAHDISYAVSEDGQTWTQFSKAARLDQSDEVFGLFAFGDGSAVFRNFRYVGIE